MDLAAADALPIYLESTEWAIPMYQRLGFYELRNFSLALPKPGTPGSICRSTVYLELCLVWYPPTWKEDEEGEGKWWECGCLPWRRRM